MPKLFNESPAFTTSDLVNALSRERDYDVPEGQQIVRFGNDGPSILRRYGVQR